MPASLSFYAPRKANVTGTTQKEGLIIGSVSILKLKINGLKRYTACYFFHIVVEKN
jgi:hypothetical protein